MLMQVHPQKIVIFYVFAGHGVQFNGMQSLLVNEHSCNFYFRFKAEYIVRKLSQNYQNSYNVVLYACCREQ